MSSLSGKVAVVTGASRGIGKGIALALAEQGAVVYVTGRTVLAGSNPLPGTIAETAAECTRRGGKGVAVAVDHADDAQVAALFQQVQDEQSRLDILVNNAFSLPEDLTDPQSFWEKPLSHWEMVDVGVRSNFVAAWHAAKIMTPHKSGLIVAVSGYTGVTYTYNVIFGTAKSAVDRMARDMAIELKPHNVTSLSLWQGLTFTERAQRNLANVPGLDGRAATRPEDGCTPEFPGRVIAALAVDTNLATRSGGTFITAELAHEYGIKDVDGKVVPSLRSSRGAPIWSPIFSDRDQPISGNRPEDFMTTSATSDRLAALDVMVDRQEIHDALTRFSRGMDRFDRDIFLSAFHDDATIAAGNFVGGPIDLYEWARATHELGQVSTHHNLLNHTCDIDGDTAHTETYYLFVGRNHDDTNWIAGGRYIDRVERRDGQWRIALRTNVIEWSGIVPTMGIPFADVPDIHVNGAPSRSTTDPSYQRPLTNMRNPHVPD